MTSLVLSILNGSSSCLQIRRTTIKAWMTLNLVKIPWPTVELAALELLKKMIYNVMTTLAPSFLIGFSSFLQLTRTTIKSWMGSKVGQIRPWTVEFKLSLSILKNPHRLIIGDLL